METVTTLTNFINGEFCAPTSGEYIDDIDPATGHVLAKIPKSSAPDVERAVAAAQRAFESWRWTSASERASWLDKIADAIEAQKDSLARLESQDSGKTLKMATSVDIPRAVANFRFFAGQIRHDETSCFHMHDAVNITSRVPLGVAGLISPWNLPLYLLSWKVAPALACGNTVIAKPSEITPQTASALARIIHEVGLPAGVFNLIHGLGSEAGQAIVEHPGIPLVSFTGGTVTGRRVAATAAPLFKKLSLELGGKNATVVCDDVNVQEVLPSIVRAAFANNGQICLAGSRVFVQAGIYDSFVSQFVEKVRQLRVGIPTSPETDVGPVSCAIHKEKIMTYIRYAKEEGGTILCGGDTPADLPASCSGGYFIAPTVIANLDPLTSRPATEEIFGPVCTIHRFNDDEEVLRYVNASKYGLAGSVWTQNLTRAHYLTTHIESGILWVNTWLHRDLRTPFGGVKESGIGREGGKYSLEFYSEWKNVCIFTGVPRPPVPHHAHATHPSTHAVAGAAASAAGHDSATIAGNNNIGEPVAVVSTGAAASGAK